MLEVDVGLLTIPDVPEVDQDPSIRNILQEVIRSRRIMEIVIDLEDQSHLEIMNIQIINLEVGSREVIVRGLGVNHIQMIREPEEVDLKVVGMEVDQMIDLRRKVITSN